MTAKRTFSATCSACAVFYVLQIAKKIFAFVEWQETRGGDFPTSDATHTITRRRAGAYGSRPATLNVVSATRCRPSSLPAGSYHSSSVCAPPLRPPAPIEIAAMPTESGILASVDDRSRRDLFPRRL